MNLQTLAAVAFAFFASGGTAFGSTMRGSDLAPSGFVICGGLGLMIAMLRFGRFMQARRRLRPRFIQYTSA
jgi:hypothetical protein